MSDEREKPPTAGDSVKRIGSGHGADTTADEVDGYARDIGQEGEATEVGRAARTKDAGLAAYTKKRHPSVNLEPRARGFGIGGGYERPYRKERPKPADGGEATYGPLPHSGYYGAGEGGRPFKQGQASFSDELDWYRSQYVEKTSGYEKKR
jgi:hypothetical protein